MTNDMIDLATRVGRALEAKGLLLVTAESCTGGGVSQAITEIAGSNLPRAVVIRDSFMSAVAPFLSEHFSRAVYVWRNDFDAASIEAEHPDVVIQEIVGRHLYDYVPTPELIPVN